MQIKTTSIFEKNFKKLYKKDRLLIVQYEKLLDDLEENKHLGTSLGDNRYKIRIKNTSSNKGKSSGYRVITYTKIENIILLVYIYSKSDIENVSNNKIDEIIKKYRENK